MVRSSNRKVSKAIIKLSNEGGELIRKLLDMVDVGHQVIAFLHLDGEELAANKEDVGQALCFMDVTQCLPCFRGTLATLDVSKLAIHQA